MGTSKSGRYLNTYGSATSVSDFSLVHSSEGKFTKPVRKTDRLRLVSGGHGQENLDLLDKYGIKYTIEKTYPNGVRVGFVPDHKKPNKQGGINQSWFPKEWTPKDIRKAGEHIARLKRNINLKDGETMYGMYKGVRVGVKKTNGRIGTVFPDANQNIKQRSKIK